MPLALLLLLAVFPPIASALGLDFYIGFVRRVLVVDDSLTVRKITGRLLAREGYRVTVAKDGLEALEKLADEVPAVVLSDIEMPRMDGFTFLRLLMSKQPTPVIVISSHAEQENVFRALDLGALDFVLADLDR